jgi:hypothetical protein
MTQDLLARLRRGSRKPPRVIVQYIARELRAEADRYVAPWHARQLTRGTLLRELNASDLTELWCRLASRPYLSAFKPSDGASLENHCPGGTKRVFEAASRALKHEVNLLGSGWVSLGDHIDWHCDIKTGRRWPPAYFRTIEYNNLDESSDVKLAWEISRLQWLIPAGQAYILSGDESYAECVRDVLSSWIEENPYAHSVNWACTMEVALRILALTWLFRVFHNSLAWRDEGFRFRLLSTIYLHGKFTERNLERSDINGNHYTADAAGLVFVGLFFGSGSAAAKWASLGWTILRNEILLQVSQDGVDYEASTSYHRLVFELFFLPVLYRRALELDVSEPYCARLQAMGEFSEAYTRPDGSAPIWGDADDARALPMGFQPINDHRYLVGLSAICWHREDFRTAFNGPLDEIYWIFGPDACKWLEQGNPRQPPRSKAFPEGGFFVMRNERDHLFIDCGPVGLAGRGGHGHNDCLAFEAVLEGVPLISDCGSYVYTASARERNHFRSTTCHNTPQVDGIEINPFIRWDYLWTLKYEAVPEKRVWRTSDQFDFFEGSHRGYQNLNGPVLPIRTIRLDHSTHSLTLHDRFEGTGNHELEIPLHLAPGVEVDDGHSGEIYLQSESRVFALKWTSDQDWHTNLENTRVSPSYGVAVSSKRIVWRRSGPLADLKISLLPVARPGMRLRTQ